MVDYTNTPDGEAPDRVEFSQRYTVRLNQKKGSWNGVYVRVDFIGYEDIEGLPDYSMNSDADGLDITAVFKAYGFSNVRNGSKITTEMIQLKIEGLHYENSLYDSYDNHKYSEGELYEGYVDFAVEGNRITNDTTYNESHMSIEVDMNQSKDVGNWEYKVEFEIHEGDEIE